MNGSRNHHPWVSRLLADPAFTHSAYVLLARCLPYLGERALTAGETLYRPGDAVDSLYLLLDGDLVLSVPGGHSLPAPEGRAGEEAATDFPARLTAAHTTQGARLLVIPHAALQTLLGSQPEVRSALSRSLTRTLAGGRLATDGAAAAAVAPAAANAVRPALIVGWLMAIVAPTLVLWLLPGLGLGLAPHAVIFLAIFATTVVMWIFNLVDEFIPGLFAVLATLAMGLVPVHVMLSGLASDGFLLAMSVLGLAAVIVVSGLGYRLLLMLLQQLPNTPFWHNAGLLLTGLLVTPLVPSINGRVALLTPFYRDMVETLRLPFASPPATRLAVSVFTGACLLSAVFLSSKSVNFVVFGLLSDQTQAQFQWLDWLRASLGTAMALLLSYFLAAGLFFRRLPRSELSRERVAAQLDLLGHMKAREWAAVGGVALFMLGVATTGLHAVQPPWLGLSVLYVLLLFGILTKDEFRQKIDWPFLMYLAGIVGLTSALNYLGLTRLLAEHLPAIGVAMRTDFPLFLALLALLIFIVRLAVPISPTIVVLATLFMPVAEASGVNAWIVGFAILVLGEMWFFPYQCSYYLQFRQLTTQCELFDETRFLRFNVLANFLKLASLYAAIPYWKLLGLL